MVSPQSVEEQLKRLSFNVAAWGRAEANELPNILLPDEEIYECVNGIYEGGFALLVATDIRVLLVDKKPLKYLTVEDLRFDMINEIDYSHRLLGAQISISAGSKNLKFRSYNQPRLRKLINHVQHCMAEAKKVQSNNQVGQNQHLEQINQQLQAYLLAQYQNQQDLNQRLEQAQSQGVSIEPLQPQQINPSPELANYLFAQNANQQGTLSPAIPDSVAAPQPVTTTADLNEMYSEGRKEIFGQQVAQQFEQSGVTPPAQTAAVVVKPFTTPTDDPANQSWMTNYNPLEINALKIAYSKLPMALRNRKFGRPSFHAHSQASPMMPTPPQIPPTGAI